MRRLAALLCLAAATAWPATAGEEIVAKLSQTRVAISTSFSGSEIFVYGAIRSERVDAEAPFDVIVAITGPSSPVIVRRKERRFGVWINGAGIQVDAAPSLYAVSTTGPFHEILGYTQDLIHKVGLDNAVRLIGDPQYDEYPEDYRRAVIRLRRDQGLYFEKTGGVTVTEGILFETSIALPAQIVEGDYQARVLLLRDREVIDEFRDTIFVRRVGLERIVHETAHEAPALYGVLAIALALSAGWAASALFRLLLP